MNKKLAEFYSGYGMTVNGQKAYGIIEGYEVNSFVSGVLNFHFSFYANDEQKRNMENDLRNATIKFCQFRFTPYGLSFIFNDMTFGGFIKRGNSLMQTITGIISSNGGLGSEYCPVCGNPLTDNKRSCDIDGFTISLDEGCVSNINAVIDAENKDFAAAPNNYLRGFLGALIGGLAGAAVAVILYVIGFYSSISAVVSVVLGTMLYRKFKGKPNAMMLVIVALTTVIFMALSVFLIYFAAAAISAAQAGSEMSAMEAFIYVMGDKEIATMFYTDLGMVLLFSAIGIGLQIFAMAKSVKRRQNIK